MNRLMQALVLFLFCQTFSGCEFLGDIFKAGIWVGIIVIIAIVVVIGFIIRLFKSK